MLTPEPKAVYHLAHAEREWRFHPFQCSPLSRRLCTLVLSFGIPFALDISVLTPEPKAVYRVARAQRDYARACHFSAHP